MSTSSAWSWYRWPRHRWFLRCYGAVLLLSTLGWAVGGGTSGLGEASYGVLFVLLLPLSFFAWAFYFATSAMLFDPGRDDVVLRAWLVVFWTGAAYVQCAAVACALRYRDSVRSSREFL